MRKLILLFAFFFPTFFAFAQKGIPDNSFGKMGIPELEQGNISFNYPPKMIIQPDGKILQVATIGFNKVKDDDLGIIVTRFNKNGTPDLQFNNKGYTVIRYNNGINFGMAIGLQHDGKIIVAGECSGVDSRQLIVRLHTDGSIDPSFGVNGYSVNEFTGEAENCRALAIQKDDKIIVSGTAVVNRELNFLLVRYDKDGMPDKSFGEAGKIILKKGWSTGSDVKIQHDGKIILAATNTNAEGEDNLILARFTTNGGADRSFGKNGIGEVLLHNKNPAPFFITLQNDGKILCAGSGIRKDKTSLLLLRFSKNGAVDKSFGNSGSVNTSLSGNDNLTGVLLQRDSKIIISGITPQDDHHALLLMRYNSDGSIDNSFGANGKVISKPGVGEDESFSIATQNNAIVAGGIIKNNGRHLVLARYK